MLTCSASTPALADALSTLLPGLNQTKLLRACLYRGAAGQAAWSAWRDSVETAGQSGEPGPASPRSKLMLLAAAQSEQALPAPPALLTTLRTAALRAELRSQTFFAIHSQLQQALVAAGIRPVVLRGTALAATTYARPALRHCHDLDLLVPLAEQERAAAVLLAAGLQPGGEPTGPGSRGFTHPSGLPVVLHGRLFSLDYANSAQAAMVARAEPAEPLKQALALAPADALLHVLGHAALAPRRPGSLWPIDAWLLISGQPDLNWTGLVETARVCRLTLPVFNLLRYLADELAAPVPSGVLEQLANHVPDALEREGALFGAQAAGGWSYPGFLRRAGSWRARAAVLQWLLLPSPAYLAAVGNDCRPDRLPLYYVERLLRQVERELAGRTRRPSARIRTGRAATAAEAAPPLPE
jgi:putative nucleotidyltransferase-like protein